MRFIGATGFAFLFGIVVTASAAQASDPPTFELRQPQTSAHAPSPERFGDPRWTNFVLRWEEGAVCTKAPTGSRAPRSSPAWYSLNHQSKSSGTAIESASAALTIRLRGTAQLERYPAAKAAFVRAADLWESLITNNLVVYIDVDFGPTAFGEPFGDPLILGSTGGPFYDVDYSEIRSALKDVFPSSAEIASLPPNSLPSDLGLVRAVAVPALPMRSLYLLPTVAAATDPAPEIAFNSAFSWDYDYTDGVDQGSIDFLSVAVHEIGHALGFVSEVGYTELYPLEQPYASMLDFYRFRPHAVTFSTDLRILSSGGEHVYASRGSRAPLSTGRLDGSGGDGNQASHWKADEQLFAYVGIMDPTLAPGTHDNVTSWDLYAFNRMGYGISLTELEPLIHSLSPEQVRVGDAVATVLVGGEEFATGAVIRWKGRKRPTTVVSSHTVSFELASSDLEFFDVGSVEVENPGSVVSNALFLRIGCWRCTRVVTRFVPR